MRVVHDNFTGSFLPIHILQLQAAKGVSPRGELVSFIFVIIINIIYFKEHRQYNINRARVLKVFRIGQKGHWRLQLPIQLSFYTPTETLPSFGALMLLVGR